MAKLDLSMLLVSVSYHYDDKMCQWRRTLLRKLVIVWRFWHVYSYCKKKKEAIPITGLEGQWSCELLRIPHYLDIRLIGGGKVISHTLLTTNIIILMFLVLISVRG
jgi:hypothetical protein